MLNSLTYPLPSLPFNITIVGGYGFVGKHLTIDLLSRCNAKQVRIIDVNIPVDTLKEWYGWEKQVSKWIKQEKIVFSQADISNLDIINHQFFKDTSILFHVASFGMSGGSMMAPKRLIWSINVLGVRNILLACLLNHIPTAVYTSSYNVCFHGQSITAGTEDSLDYSPLPLHTEEYSKTKVVAERIFLACNGMPTHLKGHLPQLLEPCQVHHLYSSPEPWSFILHEIKSCLDASTSSLSTAAIRASAIYGEGEARHFPRITSHLKNNLLSIFSFGNPSKNRVDYVHVCNLNQLHILAAKSLVQGNVKGQAFFASDDDPKSQFTLLLPFHKLYKKPIPRLNLPLWFMLSMAFILEWLYYLATTFFSFIYPPLVSKIPPAFLTRAEVYKSGQNHYCTPTKAKEILGYSSLLQDEKICRQLASMYPPCPPEWSKGSMLGMWRTAVWFAAKDGLLKSQ